MPLPSAVSNAFRMTGNVAGRVGGRALTAGLTIGGGILGYKDRVAQGQNPITAAATETAMQGLFLFLPPVAQIALMGSGLARSAGSAITASIGEHNNNVRLSRTPFSHRFEHSDVTARAQSMGLQAIGAAWGHSQMGSEAAMMARRYMR